jgi:predicted ATP-dependent protease
VRNGLRTAKRAVEAGLVEKIREGLLFVQNQNVQNQDVQSLEPTS